MSTYGLTPDLDLRLRKLREDAAEEEEAEVKPFVPAKKTEEKAFADARREAAYAMRGGVAPERALEKAPQRPRQEGEVYDKYGNLVQRVVPPTAVDLPGPSGAVKEPPDMTQKQRDAWRAVMESRKKEISEEPSVADAPGPEGVYASPEHYRRATTGESVESTPLDERPPGEWPKRYGLEGEFEIGPSAKAWTEVLGGAASPSLGYAIDADYFNKAIEEGDWLMGALSLGGMAAVVGPPVGPIVTAAREAAEAAPAARAAAPVAEGARDLPSPPTTIAPDFKKWFSGSKVVDEAGEPLVVYHGTTADFDTFETLRSPAFGAHFASSPRQANAVIDEFFGLDASGARIVPVHLSIKNPLRIPDGENTAAGILSRILEAPPNSPLRSVAEELNRTPEGNRLADMWDNGELDKYRTRLGEDWVDEPIWLRQALIDVLQKQGYDGLVYRNTQETRLSLGSRKQLQSQSESIDLRLEELSDKLYHAWDQWRDAGSDAATKPRSGSISPGGIDVLSADLIHAKNLLKEQAAINRHIAEGGRSRVEDSYVAFNPAQIKSSIEAAAPTTIAPKVTETFKAAQEGDQAAQTAAKQMLSEAAEAKQLWQEMGTDSPYFQKWFGESAVVDDAGKPLVVYHGTPHDFSVFSEAKIGSVTDAGYYGRGFTFTDNPTVASMYAEKAGGAVMPVYLSAKNPLVLKARPNGVVPVPAEAKAIAQQLFDDKGYLEAIIPAAQDKIREWRATIDRRPEMLMALGSPYRAEAIREVAIRAGYDSIIIEGRPGFTSKAKGGYLDSDAREIIIFEPTQIKSYLNKGMFDPKNPDIQASLAGALDDSSRYG